LLADRGCRVLLVEKSAWPRSTVCGGCLSASALQTLHQIGMDSAVRDAEPTRWVVWQSHGRTFEHPIPPGIAILRNDLDAAIVDNAIERGAHFLPGGCASLLAAVSGDHFRLLNLQIAGQITQVRAGIVIACDGIGGTFLKDEPWANWTISPSAMMGVAATYSTKSTDVVPGRIHMCMGKHGYVGLVQIDESTQHMAAALDPTSCRQAGGPMNLVREILRSCDRAMPESLPGARLQGTGKLTRHRKQLGGHRVLTLGDACGYVEPITGEGMAWAARGALELNRLMPQSATLWNEQLSRQWERLHWETIGRQQRWCRAMRATMHHPVMAGAGIFMGHAMPAAARWIAKAICQPPKKELPNDPIGHVRIAPSPVRGSADHSGHRHGEPAGGSAAAIAGTGDTVGLL
jgi:2-polyprenyl-6-methoxyphenol hydroxylase-like FAD-dependent oxidoreductase